MTSAGALVNGRSDSRRTSASRIQRDFLQARKPHNRTVDTSQKRLAIDIQSDELVTKAVLTRSPGYLFGYAPGSEQLNGRSTSRDYSGP